MRQVPGFGGWRCFFFGGDMCRWWRAEMFRDNSGINRGKIFVDEKRKKSPACRGRGYIMISS
jgi:hypothetical protein